METEAGGKAEKGAAAQRERRPVADVVARVAGKGQIVDGEQQPPDTQRLQCLEDELAQRIYSRAGASQIVPSGGSVIRAE